MARDSNFSRANRNQRAKAQQALKPLAYAQARQRIADAARIEMQRLAAEAIAKGTPVRIVRGDHDQ